MGLFKMGKVIVDCEPKWVNLIDLFLDMKDKVYAREELMKLAVIGDKVRQAQKNKEKLVFDFRD